MLENILKAEGNMIKETNLSEIYGQNSFGLAKLKDSLSKESFKNIKSALNKGGNIKASTADEVAGLLKNWASSKGVTHFTHIFYPLTGFTAEKHDGFISPEGERAIAKFSGNSLIQGEPDASSFPNGGIRGTHNARGYTVWDISSPVFILENENGSTLCIPTVFISWTGEALDHKLPILRSERALDTAAKKVLSHFGYRNMEPIASTAGCEQEYFLIDENYYYSRPDLIVAERTVFGAASSKGQEFSDHYFGAIPERVINFMFEVEQELYKLGIPITTRHNEVAPGQYEIAPIFESSNLAADHQQIIMRIIKSVARKHSFVATLHEKPFAGINGSGKHLNWSLGNSILGNLLAPTDNVEDNLRFQLFVAAVIQAVDRHASLLRASVASAGNDHRLGANEAPPAIISIFLGNYITNFFENIGKSKKKSSIETFLNLGVNSLPNIKKDVGDRNRTSPFAFTGNRFEFRAVGSNQNVGFPIVVLNTIMAESLEDIAKKLSRTGARSKLALKRATHRIVKSILKEHSRVIFNGDGYSAEWDKEAKKRGLPQHKTTPESLAQLSNKSTIKLFEKFNILSPRELEARKIIFLEQYIMKIDVEVDIALKLARTEILPAGITYLNELKVAGFEGLTMQKVSKLLKELDIAIEALDKAFNTNTKGDEQKLADYAQKTLLVKLDNLRIIVDQLELILPTDCWNLPTYQEMLFNK